MTPAIDGKEYTKFVTQNPKVTRGIVFAGCSFTWGQGLYYYSNLPSIREPQPNHFERVLVNSSHIAFMESVRMPRLVASHFKTFEAVHPYNGGSDESILDFWERAFDPSRKPYPHNKNRHMNDDGIFSVSDPWYDYDDFAYIVYQFTQLERTRFKFEWKGKTYNFNVHYARNGSQSEEEGFNAFLEWLLDREMTYEQWQARCPCRNDDNNPSLSIKDDNGKVVVYCHRGKPCSASEICDAVGLTQKDLFPPSSTFDKNNKPKQRLVKTYKYIDANGELAYEKQRFLREDGTKSFLQRRPNPEKSGDWITKR